MDWLTDGDKNADWHRERLSHIGASEIAAVLGESDFKTAHELFLEKTSQREVFKGNFATEQGQEAEPIIRQIYSEMIGEEISVPPSAGFKEWNVLTASPDGLVGGIPIEIKYLSAKKYEEIKKTGKVPKTYYAQVQQQMLVFGAETAIFIAVSQSIPIENIAADSICVLKVPRDEDFLHALATAAREFWKKVEAKKWIDEEVDHATLCGWLEQIEILKIQTDEIDRRIEVLRDKIKAQVPDKLEVNGWSVKWIDRKGNIDYTKIEALKTMDLELYRKAGTRVLDIRRK